MTDSPIAHPPGPSALVVFPWCLDRIGHGNIQRILALGRYLSEHGVAVDLVYQGNPGVASVEESFTFCRRVVRVESWQSSDAHRVGRELLEFYDGHEPPPPNLMPGTALTVAVRGLLDAMDYTAVLSTYAWTAPILAPLAKRALRIVDLQDVLSLHGERSARATGSTSPFSLNPDTERFLWRQWDVLLAITPAEADVVAPWLRPSQRLLTVGHAVDLCGVRPPAGSDILYAGSDNPSNQQALSWLVRSVWPRVLARNPAARLRVVGLICDALSKSYPEGVPGIDLAGFVDDPWNELQRARAVVAPYLYGSGLKLKVLEAAAAGRAVVTTSSGVEGSGLTPGRHAVVADDPEQFADAICRLLEDELESERMGRRARAFVAERYSPDACYAETLETIRAHARMPAVRDGLPTAVESRLRAVLNALSHPRVVVWGNGSHTRMLVPLLQRLGATPHAIIDKSSAVACTSAEGVRVIPASGFEPGHRDLIVLSSQSFEGDMWNDLAQLRAAGAMVLGLYRRELSPPGVDEALHGVSRRSRRTAATRPGSRRLVVMEPSAGRSRGPFLRLARALHTVGSAAGVDVSVAGARQLRLENLQDGDRVLLHPAFEFAHWDMLLEKEGSTWRNLSRFARLMSTDMATVAERVGLGTNDVVLIHTANLVDVVAVGMWLGSCDEARLPGIRLLFHFTPSQEAQWLNATEEHVVHAYALALAMLDERVGDRLLLLAQNEMLAPVLAKAFGRIVQPVGFPVFRPEASAEAHSRPRIRRVLFGGEARADKGFGVLPAVAEALRTELDAGSLELVCQSSQNEFADAAIREAIAALGRQRGVTLVDGFLSSDDYDALMGSCDSVLLPYDASQYRSRLSAVFVDATRLGIPVVVPDGTWMSHQLAHGLGSGTTFARPTGRLIAAAIRRAIASPRLQADARAAMPRVWERHDPATVLAAILGDAITSPRPSSATDDTVLISREMPHAVAV